MIDIILYNFSKKENSTKQPSSTGTTYECLLKDNCSIVSPIIKLDLGHSNSPTAYNYAYIEDFDRYYFISNWSYDKGIWYGELKVDVLASFKTEIGNSTLYVLRSSNEDDDRIVEKKYPLVYRFAGDSELANNSVSIKTEDNSTSTTNLLWSSTIFQGTVIVGCISKADNGYTNCALTYNNYTQLIHDLLETFPSDFGDLANGISKAIYNPLQYIVRVYWLPFTIPGVSNTEKDYINIGQVKLDVPASGPIDITKKTTRLLFYTTIPTHPLTDSKGKYVNTSPYTELVYKCLPFGTFNLDTMALAGSTKIWTEIVIDISTGEAELFIYTDNNSSPGILIQHSSAKYGIDLPVVQSTIDYVGIGTGLVNMGLGVASAAVSSASFNPTGQVIGAGIAAKGIGDTIDSMIPSNNTKGLQGSAIHFTSYGRPVLYGKFRYPTDENPDHWGRPLCQEKEISDIPGYIECGDSDIDISCFESERIEIGNYLTNGFFYE